jgi:hypothetical protein
MNLILLLVLLIINIVIVYWVHKEGDAFYSNRISQKKIHPKIYDIGLKYLPDFSKIKFFEFLSHFIAFILPFCFGKKVYIEFLSYAIPVILIRYIFISLTILPKEKTCDNKSFGPINFLIGHCYDKIFSGHFASGVLLSLILLKNGYNPIYLGIFNILNALLIISLRFHYTIDIVVAALVVLLVYQNKMNINF